jgi:hypothetical protein
LEEASCECYQLLCRHTDKWTREADQTSVPHATPLVVETPAGIEEPARSSTMSK